MAFAIVVGSDVFVGTPGVLTYSDGVSTPALTGCFGHILPARRRTLFGQHRTSERLNDTISAS